MPAITQCSAKPPGSAAQPASAPAPRLANCFQDTGFRYWNENTVLVFPSLTDDAIRRTVITALNGLTR